MCSEYSGNWPYCCLIPNKICWPFNYVTTEIPLLGTLQYEFFATT